jgi:large subunit ribosomal protein L22
MKAVLSNYHQSPRKVRLVADLVRGKRVADALTALSFLEKRAALPFKKVIASALANAKSAGKEENLLVIGKVTVDKGTVSRRFMPRARGSASPINRRSSHIAVQLIEKEVATKKRKSSRVAPKAE